MCCCFVVQVYVEATRPMRGSDTAAFSTFDVLNGDDRTLPSFVGQKKNLLDLKTLRQRVAERKYKDARK